MLNKQSENLEKQSVSASDSEVNNVDTVEGNSAKRNKVIPIDGEESEDQIRGWLLYFLFAMGVVGLVSIVHTCYLYVSNLSSGSTFLYLTDLIAGGILLVLAIMAIYGFLKRTPKAVFYAKFYAVFLFVYYAYVISFSYMHDVLDDDAMSLFRSLVWSIVCFCYLTFSEQVAVRIPKAQRKVSFVSYCAAVIIVLLPILMFQIGFTELVAKNSISLESIIEEVELGDGEYTDGFVVFQCPEGYICSVDIDENVGLLHNLESELNGSLTIVGAPEIDFSKDTFDEYWKGWRPTDVRELPQRLLLDEKYKINGYSYYIKTVCYDIEDAQVFWRYVFMFDPTQDKVCVISSLDLGDSSYMNELLGSIRFVEH